MASSEIANRVRRVLMRACCLCIVSAANVRGQATNTATESLAEDVTKLRNKAAEFYNRADYPRALDTMKQAIKAAEAAWGDGNTNVAEILDLTAGVYRTQGDHSNALALCKRSLAIREKSLGQEHPDVATSLFALASLYNDTGDYAQALELGQRSLMIREKVFGREHQDVAASLAILSKIYVNQGDYSRALESLNRAFSFWEKHFETNPYLAVTSLNDMASVNQDLGNYDSSLRLYQEVAVLYEKLYGPEHPSLAACWNNIASIYEQQGSYTEALDFHQRSLSLKVKTLGSEHPDVGLGLNNSAQILVRLGKHAEALKLYQRALSVLEKALGEKHPNVATVLNNIAELYEQQGDTSKALPLFERSLDINLKVFGNEHPRVASTLNNLASVCESLGKIPQALVCYERSRAIYEQAIGPEHPKVISILRNTAVLWMRQKNPKAALEVFAEAFRRRRSYFVLQFSEATDSEAIRTIYRDRYSDEMFHSLCGDETLGDRAKMLGVEQLALNKGILEEVRATRAALESSPETAVQKLRQQRQAALARLESLPKTQLRPEQQAETRREIEAEIKTIDDKLSERAPLAVLSLRDRSASAFQIARSLPPNSALVDFVYFSRFDSTGKTNWWKEQCYAAYLTFPLANDSTNVVVQRVDLGEAAPINEALGIVAKRFSAKPPQYLAKDLPPAFQQLSDLVYAPLAPYLTNTSHLIICPDGELSRLPFEMLAVGNKFLMEEKTISYVTSGREIVRLAANQSNQKSRTHTAKSLVMGNPDFDFDLASARSASPPVQIASRAAALRSVSRDFRGLTFKPLPGAETEARSVAKLLGSESELRLGAEAREAELKAVKSPRVLHLATHGFFLSDQDFKGTNALAWSSPFPQSASRRGGSRNDWENPLVRCGIALAGANRAQQITNAIAEDGVLTGLEASLLNLQGTELVILSACQSGAGDVRIGEGVMSLRRAFRIAGAETVLASHWSVSDKATSQLMTEFMRRWRAGEPRARAWREAQLSLIRSKGAKEDYSNPFFWSAFTLTGQWR
jgi:CHAT domain-containing protein/tetratricopeptide (TPR) repeat protein